MPGLARSVWCSGQHDVCPVPPWADAASIFQPPLESLSVYPSFHRLQDWPSGPSSGSWVDWKVTTASWPSRNGVNDCSTMSLFCVVALPRASFACDTFCCSLAVNSFHAPAQSWRLIASKYRSSVSRTSSAPVTPGAMATVPEVSTCVVVVAGVVWVVVDWVVVVSVLVGGWVVTEVDDVASAYADVDGDDEDDDESFPLTTSSVTPTAAAASKTATAAMTAFDRQRAGGGGGIGGGGADGGGEVGIAPCRFGVDGTPPAGFGGGAIGAAGAGGVGGGGAVG